MKDLPQSLPGANREKLVSMMSKKRLFRCADGLDGREKGASL